MATRCCRCFFFEPRKPIVPVANDLLFSQVDALPFSVGVTDEKWSSWESRFSAPQDDNRQIVTAISIWNLMFLLFIYQTLALATTNRDMKNDSNILEPVYALSKNLTRYGSEGLKMDIPKTASEKKVTPGMDPTQNIAAGCLDSVSVSMSTVTGRPPAIEASSNARVSVSRPVMAPIATLWQLLQQYIFVKIRSQPSSRKTSSCKSKL